MPMVRKRLYITAAALAVVTASALIPARILTLKGSSGAIEVPLAQGETPSTAPIASPTPAAPPPLRVVAVADTYTQTAQPQAVTGQTAQLVAGGLGGGAAITYLKFEVRLPEGRLPERARLWLGVAQGPLPEIVELSLVPDGRWTESTMTAASAPRLGDVIESLSPQPTAETLSFDITRKVRGSGVMSFAVTAPTSAKRAYIVASEADSSSSRRPTITFQWPGAPSPAPWAQDTSTTPQSPAPLPPPAQVKCVAGKLLVPNCGALWGVAAGAHTPQDRIQAFRDFENRVNKPQQIYHAYHRGEQMFPTKQEIALARDTTHPRVLFLNWKPYVVKWSEVPKGKMDAYLDKLSAHIKANFREQFFFTVHHEPENDVRPAAGSGMTAKDFAAAFRYVIKRLRANGVNNLITVMNYMAFIKWVVPPWFNDLYPGDDVVDWVAWDIYSYSDPGYGFGDFSEMMNRVSASQPSWPGFYNWATRKFPNKPFMIGEWGIWYSARNPGHQAAFFESARQQIELYPRIKAWVYFESPNAEGRDCRVHVTQAGLQAFQRLSQHPIFEVRLP